MKVRTLLFNWWVPLALAGMTAGGLFAWSVSRSPVSKPDPASRELRSVRRQPSVQPGTAVLRKKVSEGRYGRSPLGGVEEAVAAAAKTNALSEAEKELNALELETLRELRKLVGISVDVNAVRALYRRLKEAGYAKTSDIPVVLRRALVAALGRAGVAGIPDLLEFAADADMTISGAAVSELQRSLMDISLSDYDRSSILVELSGILEDPAQLRQVLFMVNMSRPSVGVGTIVSISETGTSAAKELVPALFKSFTLQDLPPGADIKALAAEFLEKRPDPSFADMMFGGFKKRN